MGEYRMINCRADKSARDWSQNIKEGQSSAEVKTNTGRKNRKPNTLGEDQTGQLIKRGI